MADLDSLGYTSISDMSQDEALEQLRQIRLSRRTPVKPPPKTTKTKLKTVASKAAKNLDKQSVEDLLKMIGE